jgi:hypothetical protein
MKTAGKKLPTITTTKNKKKKKKRRTRDKLR